MPARIKAVIIEYALPLLMFAFALGAAEYQLVGKEDASDHKTDIESLRSEMKETHELLLDVRCEQKPTDRRCK